MNKLIKYTLNNIHNVGAIIGILIINIVCGYNFLCQLAENGWTL